ncbi:MAG: transporter permease [Microbacteriaceae bacterium]|nr:transporter permease [Microbacteriaceae bacterium]
MNVILAGFGWIFTASHWTTVNLGPGIGQRVAEHLFITLIALVFVVLIAVPLGLFIGHTGKGRTIAIAASNISRALPTLGLLAVLILFLGIGLLPITVVLVLLGIPPLLAGVYSGLESVDRTTIDAARAVGMTELQILLKVEVPLSIALLIGGLRAATLQIIATVAVAATFSGGGLGNYVISGVAQADYAQMMGGAILITALALVVDGLFALVQRFVVPRGVSRGTSRRNTARAGAIPVVATTRTLIKEGQ